MNSPIALFTYNRLKHTKKTLEALAQNKLAASSDLYVYSDGPKNRSDAVRIASVRKYLRTVKGFRKISIIERSENFGLARSIIMGVTEIVNTHGTVIVLEDDTVTSPYFLTFMNDALELYEKDEDVMHISGYMFPVKDELPETFFYNQTSCWGWATWKRAWKFFNPDASYLLKEIRSNNAEYEFNVDGSNKTFIDQLEQNVSGIITTWAIKWDASVFLHRGLCLHPNYSYVTNIGHDGSGANCGKSNIFNTFNAGFKNDYQKPSKIVRKESVAARRAMSDFYRYTRVSLYVKGKISLKLVLKSLHRAFSRIVNKVKFETLYRRYRRFTMIPKRNFLENLSLIKDFSSVDGCVVECGVWRGGMMAAIVHVLGNKRHYHLFDSFEGLPQAKIEDGKEALDWQNDTNSPHFFDNCSAKETFAERAMRLSRAENYSLHKGWFKDTLPKFSSESKIAILRLDADWYESTMECLENLYNKVALGGIIILDDYYRWSGCSKAVHEFLARNKLDDKIYQYKNGQLCYIIKR